MEIFSSSTFHPEVFLGDEEVLNLTNSICEECIGLRPYSNFDGEKNAHLNNSTINRARRENIQTDTLPPHDGILDINSNYTGFVEILGKFS